MKLSKIIKILEKEFKIKFWISLLPITLLIWIISQLLIITQYNAIMFFSWWQVLNDTIIFSLLVLALILWYLSHDLFLKFKPNIWEKWRWGLFIFYILFLSFFILWFIAYFTNSFYYYITWIILFYFVWYILYLSFQFWKSKWDKKLDEKYWIFLLPSLYLIMYLLVFTILFSWVKMLNNFIYQNIEIKINDQNHKINYMNDKYIFYSSWSEIKIIPYDGKYEFIIKNPLKTN